MWPRTVEAMLACWLAISPFIFQHDDSKWSWWWNDWITAALIMSFALLSFVHQTRRAHLLELVVAAWLIGFGWVDFIRRTGRAGSTELDLRRTADPDDRRHSQRLRSAA